MPNKEIQTALKRSLAVILGYIPLSFACSSVTLLSGIPPWPTVRLAILAYTGASQLVAVEMLQHQSAVIPILFMVLAVNSRLLLMSAAVATHLQGFSWWQRLLFAFNLTDEAFALHATAFHQQVGKIEMFAVNISLYVAWILGSCLAAFFSILPHQQVALGLDYAPIAMFIILLVLLVKRHLEILILLLSGALAVLLRFQGLMGWDVLIAASAAAALGVFLQPRLPKSNGSIAAKASLY
jgi:4-azaleucine resistance transporter AzlC